MGNRLTKIYTKTGDAGQTGLADGSRIDKDDPAVETMGDIDELNSAIGLLLAQGTNNDSIANCLTKTQNLLFDIGGEIAAPQYIAINDTHVEMLETHIDELNSKLPPLKEFILPRGDKATCCCHLARSICRRAERRMVSLQKTRKINLISLKFLNRLSDYLFVTARTLAKLAKQTEQSWDHIRQK